MKILEIVRNAQDAVYAKCDLKIDNFSPEHESSEYYAHTCVLKNKHILFRIAKKTPTKIGWFVTIWKRSSDDIIYPYHKSDPIDYVVIAVLDNNNLGEFIFPKEVLLKNKIFSNNDEEGKRAIRVYTPWDKPVSPQAIKTQIWQNQFFINLGSPNPDVIQKIKTLYA